MAYKFEFYGIDSKEKFEEEIKDIMENGDMCNYEQLARLFYEQDGGFVMVELQVPTKTMLESIDKDYVPWLDAYAIKSFEDYDASEEIFTDIKKEYQFTFENTEQIMLDYAKALFK